MLAGPTIRRRRLGTDLRRLREARSLKLEDVAAHLGVAQSTLSRIETGKAPTRTSYLAIMLDLYGVTDQAQRRQLADLAREGQRKGWWTECDEPLPAGLDTYLGLEAEARSLLAFEADVVHDLLQTEPYAGAVLAAQRPGLSPAQVAQLVAVRLRRQEVLAGAEPIRLHLILDESALLRSMGPRPLMRAQLDRVAEVASLPMVTVQVLRLSAERRVLAGSFGILGFADQQDADVVCSDGLRGQILLEERAGEVRAMRQVFEALSRSALPAPQSAKVIRELAGPP